MMPPGASEEDDDNDGHHDEEDDDIHQNGPLSASSLSSSSLSPGTVLTSDESLTLRFQRAVVLQRAGEYNSALQEYQTFIKAATSCNVSLEMYAEVHVNMGAIYMRQRNWTEARKNFEIALGFREDMSSAHVNLAVLVLSETQASSSMSLYTAKANSGVDDPKKHVIETLQEARSHCQRALDISLNSHHQNDVHSRNAATRLLRDIDEMLRQPSW